MYLSAGGTHSCSKRPGEYFVRCCTDTLPLHYLWMKRLWFKKARTAVKLNTGVFESYVTSLEKSIALITKCVAYISDEIQERIEGSFCFFFLMTMTNASPLWLLATETSECKNITHLFGACWNRSLCLCLTINNGISGRESNHLTQADP